MANDNYKDETEFLLAQADEMLRRKCGEPKVHAICHLMNGDSCPLLTSAMTTMKMLLLKQL